MKMSSRFERIQITDAVHQSARRWESILTDQGSFEVQSALTNL